MPFPRVVNNVELPPYGGLFEALQSGVVDALKFSVVIQYAKEGFMVY